MLASEANAEQSNAAMRASGKAAQTVQATGIRPLAQPEVAMGGIRGKEMDRGSSTAASRNRIIYGNCGHFRIFPTQVPVAKARRHRWRQPGFGAFFVVGDLLQERPNKATITAVAPKRLNQFRVQSFQLWRRQLQGQSSRRSPCTGWGKYHADHRNNCPATQDISSTGQAYSPSTSRKLTRPMQAGSVLRATLSTQYRRVTAEPQPARLALTNAVMIMRSPLLILSAPFTPETSAG